MLYSKAAAAYFRAEILFLSPGTIVKPRQEVINTVVKPMSHRVRHDCKPGADGNECFSH